MAKADTRGDDRTKPTWGEPAGPSAARRRAEAAPSKAEAARLAREQAKAARAEAKAERARRRQERAAARAGGEARRPATRASSGRAAPAAGGARKAARPTKGASAPAPPARSRAAAGAAGAAAPGRGRATPAGGRSRSPSTKAAAAAAPARRRATATTAPARTPAKGATRRAGPAPRSSPRSRTSSFRARYAVVHDVEGPRVRLGVLWFLTALFAILGGSVTTALVYGIAAALAAAQVASAWRRKKARPNEAMTAAGALLVALGASFGAGAAGLALLGLVALAFTGAAGDTTSRNPRLADVGWTLQAGLPPAIVALSVVLLTRLDQGSAVSLLLLVSAFETGDFLIGSGARNPFEGPAAGAAGIVVVTFIVSTLPFSTLSFGETWVLGGAVAVLAPLGQLLASALLPSATAPATAFRRLDSLLLTAPLWAWAVGVFG